MYEFNSHGKCVEDLSCAITNLHAILDVELWHACFGHLNFTSLLCLQKYDMVSSLPKL